MTRIDFYLNAESKLHLACRLALKALRQRLKTVIHAPNEVVARDIDRVMWVVPSTGFVPHCWESSRLAAETPIVIARTEESHVQGQLLLNLGDDAPRYFSRFDRMIEIVARDDEQDKSAARARFRFYKERGYELTHHDMGKAT